MFLGLRTKQGIDESLTLSTREGNFQSAEHGLFQAQCEPHQPLPDVLLAVALGEAWPGCQGRSAQRGGPGRHDCRRRCVGNVGVPEDVGRLKPTKGFDSESEFVVWNEIISRLSSVQSSWIFEDQSIKHSLEAFQRDLVSPKAHKLGWEFKESDGHIEQQFKAMLFGSAGLAGDQTIIAAAKDMFAKFMAGDRSAIHPTSGAVSSGWR